MRIRKTLGYGITDLKTDRGIIIDSRLNEKWAENMWEWKDKTIDGLLDFAKMEAKKQKFNNNLLLYKNASYIGGGNPCLDDFLTYDQEFGIPRVLVLTPITGTEWKRIDDQLDYYEERTKGNVSLEPHVEILDVPLYPYDNYINNITGELADNMVRDWIYQIRNAVIDLRTERDNIRHDKLIKLIKNALEKLGCRMHWTEKWNVAIPEEIQNFCRYTEMFTDEKYMWQLLPMIYTYWT